MTTQQGIDHSIELAERMFEMFDSDSISLARRQLDRGDLADRQQWGLIYRHLVFLSQGK